MIEQLKTVNEAATEVFRVKPATVYTWIAEGRLPVVRLGRTIRIRVRDIEQALADGLPVASHHAGRRP